MLSDCISPSFFNVVLPKDSKVHGLFRHGEGGEGSAASECRGRDPIELVNLGGVANAEVWIRTSTSK